MAFTPMNGRCTGFEMGTVDLAPIGVGASWSGSNNPEISSVDKHTGTYAMRMKANGIYKIYVVPGLSEIYFGLWYRLDHIPVVALAGYHYITVYYDNGEYVQFKVNYQAMWDMNKYHLDINGNPVLDYTEYGTIPITTAWHNFMARVKIDNSGNIETIIDGIPDIVFSGDTLFAGSPTIQRIEIFHQYEGQYDTYYDYSYWDDFTIGTGGWPGDYRYDVLMPNADSSHVDWVASTGSDFFELINEKPPSDTDYIYTITDDAEARFVLEDWDGTDKTPVFVQYWARAQKDEAAAHKLTFINHDAGNDVPGTPQDMLVSYTYVAEIFSAAPDAGPWTEAKLQGAFLDMKATIV